MATAQVSSLLVVEGRGGLSLWLEARLRGRREDLCIVADLEMACSDVILLVLVQFGSDFTWIAFVLVLSLLLSEVLAWHFLGLAQCEMVMFDVLDELFVSLALSVIFLSVSHLELSLAVESMTSAQVKA